MRRSIGVGERRARLARRHHLSGRSTSLVEVAGDLCGLHASDPVSIFLAARARVDDLDPPVLERALYDRRELVKLLAMRRTLFVVPTVLAGVLQSACANALAVTERKRLVRQLELDGVAPDGERWLSEVGERAVRALDEQGASTVVELGAAVPELREKLYLSPGKSYAATVSAGSRVLLLLAIEGRAVRGRPRGSWISTQYRWASARDWFGGRDLPAVPEVEARQELARRWLRTYGPAYLSDLRWWSGWTVGATRQALADAGAVEVDVSGQAGFVLPDDLAPEPPVESWVALLPSLDPTAMGWRERDWYVGEHRSALFDRNGNIGPTVWVDGRIVGGWSQRADGQIALGLLEDVGTEARSAIEQEAEKLQSWLGPIRFTPRFPTPLQQELFRS